MPQLSNNTMNISKMNVKRLKQELTQRGLPTDGLKPALVALLEQAIQQDEEEENQNSNEAFHSVYARLEPQLKKVTEKEREVAEHEARLAAARTELEAARAELGITQSELTKLEPRLSFSPKLPTSVLLSIVGQVGKKAGERAACTKA